MATERPYFAEVLLGGDIPLAAVHSGQRLLRERSLVKEFLEYVHIQKGLLEPYNADYPLIEARELLPSFEITFHEYKFLPSFSMVVFNRSLDYQQEVFQFDLLHSLKEQDAEDPGSSRSRQMMSREHLARETLDRLLPHLTKELRAQFKQSFAQRDSTDLASYGELLDYLFHMDRAHVIAKDAHGIFRILGSYASFPSELDTEIKTFGRRIGKFKAKNNQLYEKNRYFVSQFFMELYGFPIASERRTSCALFARKLSRMKEQYLIKVLGASDRVITSLSGLEQKQFPLVEKTALVPLPSGLEEADQHFRQHGYYVDEARQVIILRVTYMQHKYNRHNVQEDRALSVVKQEVVHPITGQKEAGFNILKDTKSFLIDLNDIVRGEYVGSISYRREGQITSIKTHDDRLKFLDAYLNKNQRRITSYSQEFFEDIKKVLNSYILNPEYRAYFKKYPALHREVVRTVAYLQQSHQLQQLERLVQRRPPYNRRLSLLQLLGHSLDFVETHQDEIPLYYDDLYDKLQHIILQALSHPYLKTLRGRETPPEEHYPRTLWQMMRRLWKLQEDIALRYKEVKEADRNGSLGKILFQIRPNL